MKAKKKTIYSPAEEIRLNRLTPEASFNNIDTATFLKAKRSTKSFLLIADGESHLTNDPERTADRHGYRDFEIFEIERL